MINNDICETLLAVKEVKLSFERTIRNINNIQHRYNMVSVLKRKAAKAKESFEAEIQAAIMEPTSTKVSNLPRKSLKTIKTLPLMGNKRFKRGKKAKLTTVQESFKEESEAAITKPSLKKRILLRVKKNNKKTTRTKLPVLSPISYSESVPQRICFRATSCTYEIHSGATQIMQRQPYGDLIRRLYRAARWKAQQEAMDQQDHEQSPDGFICRCSCSSC